MAAAFVAGAVGLTQLDDGFVRREDIQALLPRVKATFSKERAQGNATAALYDQVTVTLLNGSTVRSEPVYQAKGHAKRPLSRAERESKFTDCLAFGGVNGGAASLFATIDDLEALANARAIALPL